MKTPASQKGMKFGVHKVVKRFIEDNGMCKSSNMQNGLVAEMMVHCTSEASKKLGIHFGEILELLKFDYDAEELGMNPRQHLGISIASNALGYEYEDILELDIDLTDVLLNRSSNKGEATPLTVLRAQVRDAYRMLEMLQDGYITNSKYYPEMPVDATNFVNWVDRMKEITKYKQELY